MSANVKIRVHHNGFAYTTNRVQGKTCTSTSDPDTAAKRLAEKVAQGSTIQATGTKKRADGGWEYTYEIISEDRKMEKKAMTAAERQAKRKAELVAQGGQIVKAALSPRAAAIVEKLALVHGSKSAAIEWALLQHEQQNLPL